MITNLILLPFFNIINVLLTPLNVINWGIDNLINIPILSQFFSVIAYVIPWTYIMPLIYIIFSIIGFKVVISLLKTIANILPFF